MRRNQLAPAGAGAKLMNFVVNIFWAVVWLGRWTIRLVKGLLKGGGR